MPIYQIKDNNGYWLREEICSSKHAGQDYLQTSSPDSSLVRPKWNGTSWIEDASIEDQENILIRIERNKKLSASDWTQVADAPLTAQQVADWATYRQTLRDLPANTPDPKNFTWPAEPS